VTDALEQLGQDLERRFQTAHTVVPIAGRDVDLLHPRDYDDLISEEEFVRDDRLPYWADIWPSSHALAERVARLDGRGRTAIELGCGLGLVMAAAARAGYRALATDYYDDALEFARVNVWRNAGVAIETRHVDWRRFPADLGRFDLVLASDVLYERSYAPLLADAFSDTLAKGGAVLLADPGRVGREEFLSLCAPRGLYVREAEEVPFASGDVKQTITIFELIRPW
jgi:predicted nicotinamide N-methyase